MALDDADDDQLYFSLVSPGNILKGVTVLPESKRPSELCNTDSTKLYGRGSEAASCW